MSHGAASMTPPKSDQRLASWVLWNGWADGHLRLIVNGSFWLGAAAGALASPFLLDQHLFSAKRRRDAPRQR